MVPAATTNLRLLHGSEEPLQALRPLQAGPLSALLDGIDLRYIRLGELELVRRIYVAVRDRNWNTIPGAASAVAIAQRADAFEVAFRVRHSSHDTDFSWDGKITGTPDGRITFRMDGAAEREMLYNRVGFCVLHPWREYAGSGFEGETPDGQVHGAFPDTVAPQRFENGVYVPLFPSVSGLSVDLEQGVRVQFEFEGDLFETEDQRNWTDASFKTYCTPLALGFPHRLAAGERKSQAVSVSAVAHAVEAPAGPAAPSLTFGEPTGRFVPEVGLALPAGAEDVTEDDARLLRTLAPAHLRADLHLADPRWPDALAGAIGIADRIGAQLELVLFIPDAADAPLSRLRELLAGRHVARVLVAPEGAQTTTPAETTPPALVRQARGALALGSVPFAGGTDMYFCELNRTRPQVEEMDGVFWSLNGQVHAFDDVSLLETPEAQGEQVRTAREFAPGRAIFVGPVTLRRRYNVNATVAEDEDAAESSDSVDPRQAALIGAAWTLASAKHLAEQGADAITYFETVGSRGVTQGGQAFPLFHVLSDVAELRGREIVSCVTDKPLEVAGFAIAQDARGGGSALIANLTPQPLTVAVRGLAERGRVRRLNADSAEGAMFDPQQFRGGAAQPEGIGELNLAPYETVRIDI
jgi:hypothetical protein